MEQPLKTASVFQVTGKIIAKLGYTLDTSAGRASLANLRNSMGKPLSETVEIWPLIFDSLPIEFLSASGNVTDQERAILTTLQLYALHQQGSHTSVALNEATEKWENIGNSLHQLRTGDDVALDRRFNTMITSSSYEELTHHLRQLIMLMKSRSNIKVNYAKLADDLYWFLRGYQENMRIRWAQSYYRTKTTGEKGDPDHVQ